MTDSSSNTSSSTQEPSKRREIPEIRKAKDILRGREASVQEVIDLAAALKKQERFGFARKLLGRAWETDIGDADLRRKVRQERTLCTYKDPDLSVGERLDAALEILGSGEEDLSTTNDQESLGLAGAIFKRRFELDAHKGNLERSLTYYLRGFDVGPESDQGYTGINAAFVLDLLADLEARESAVAGAVSKIAHERRNLATSIREKLVESLSGLLKQSDFSWLATQWWYYATVIEALFGLGRYHEALEWVERGMDAVPDVPDWEYASTATQLASLARLRVDGGADAKAFERSSGAEVLSKLLKGRAQGVRTAFMGKVGLALSGGGFRASLYHIGVLARLADLDMLRHVEVVSCVSGGSILGAHYYLELKKLLEEKADEEITRKDYVELVRRVETDFLAGVQTNIRMRVAAEFTTNLKMIFVPGYSRTMRVGELYERHIFSRVGDGNGTKPRFLTDLFIHPKDESEGFRPTSDNWRRTAKVPDLILNATTLNTGHSWRFTASWMGEPPGSIDSNTDANYCLRQMYYWEAPKKFQYIRLGHAVGASACVPGVFEPLSFTGLYPEITVRLVDGGVHDNQGIGGLLEQDCRVVFVSDASGQMGTVDQPSAGSIGVPLRSNSILQGRIRSEQCDEISARHRSGLLRNYMFVHLMQDLDDDPRDWVDCQDPYDPTDAARPATRTGPLTEYGIRRDVQRKIAAIRTDLDSFSDSEADALMLSGYRMTEHAFKHVDSLKGLPTSDEPPESWRFLAADDAMRDVNEGRNLLRLLDVGSRVAFKVWHLVTPLKVFAIVLSTAGVAGLAWFGWTRWHETLLQINVSTIGTLVLIVLGSAVFGKGIMRIARFRSTLQRIAIGISLAGVGFLGARLHLHVFDKLFLRVGRRSR